MSNAAALTQDNFEATVSGGVTLIDFWAEWCGPCKMIAPAIDELAAAYDGKANITKVNVDEEGELAQKFGVASIPTLLILKDGEEVNRFVGVTPKDDLAKAIDAVLG